MSAFLARPLCLKRATPVKTVDEIMADWREKGRSPHALVFELANKFGLTDQQMDAFNLVVEYAAWRERQATKAALEKQAV